MSPGEQLPFAGAVRFHCKQRILVLSVSINRLTDKRNLTIVRRKRKVALRIVDDFCEHTSNQRNAIESERIIFYDVDVFAAVREGYSINVSGRGKNLDVCIGGKLAQP